MPVKFSALILLCAIIIGACAAPGTSLDETPVAKTMTLYSWVDYMPQSVLDAFEQEYGIKVAYEIYETQEEAVENIRAGGAYDLVTMGPEYIPNLIAENQVQPIEYEYVENFKYISPNFRELSFDPGNKYSIPFHWGNTGILVRTDLVDRPITSWNDLWDPQFAGKVGLWNLPRDVISIALKAQGYSINSNDPQALNAARNYLLTLKKQAQIMPGDESSIVPKLATGELVIGYGWAYDATLAAETGMPIEYIIPQEGSILWSDHWIIPASAANPRAAELFINFILRPEISGEIINYSFYPIPHDRALEFVTEEIKNNTAIYPPAAAMKKSELILPLSNAVEARYYEVWNEFIAAP
jgi:spermidine/putrescine transport system substrate-binding protein